MSGMPHIDWTSRGRPVRRWAPRRLLGPLVTCAAFAFLAAIVIGLI